MGQVIVGVLLVIPGLLGAEEFVAGSAWIITIPTGTLLAIAGAVVIHINRPTIDHAR